jgi:hypothetical protein
MKLDWRGIGISAMLPLVLFGPFALVARAADWTVLFRASNPKIWNTSAGDESTADGYSVPPVDIPPTVRYLRLKRMDTGAAVIVGIKRKQIFHSDALDDELFWTGASSVRSGTRLLGIGRRSWPTETQQDQLVARSGGGWNVGFRGWGFSKSASSDPSQTYSWEGSRIDKTVFEIAVTADELNDDEKPLLLSFAANPRSHRNSGSPADSSSKPPPAPPVEIKSAGLSTAGPTTQISKLQTSIEALYIIKEPSGGMLGLAPRFILTASPGKPNDPGTVPVTFTTPVGNQTNMVLDDVTRAIDVRYSLSGLKKIELSFEDK